MCTPLTVSCQAKSMPKYTFYIQKAQQRYHNCQHCNILIPCCCMQARGTGCAPFHSTGCIMHAHAHRHAACHCSLPCRAQASGVSGCSSAGLPGSTAGRLPAAACRGRDDDCEQSAFWSHAYCDSLELSLHPAVYAAALQTGHLPQGTRKSGQPSMSQVHSP